MGDLNQLAYLKRVMPRVDGAVLEVGSKDYGSTASFRDFYAGARYVGIDMEDGRNVDLIVDLTQGHEGLATDEFALGICCSVLEHVRRPWIFAEELSDVISPGGSLYMSVPWVWRYHPYPDDYFRFSWRGVMELFPRFEWRHICYSTNVPGEFIDITQENTGADNAMAAMAETPQGKRKYLPYLMVNMLGLKT